MMYPIFARVQYLGPNNEIKSDDIWFFANNYGDAVRRIEDYFDDTLLGLSMYMFDMNDFLFQNDLLEMELKAKRVLGIY